MLRLLLLVGLWNAPATPGEADGLYRQGNTAAAAERWDEALALWARAEALAPQWKYAFNQASVLAFLGRPAEAWAACERARAHGVPPEHAGEVDAEQRRIEDVLLADHALLALTVEPADACVTLDGAPLAASGRAILRRATSRLVVAREGHATLDEPWAHPIGARTSRTVRLASLPLAASAATSGAAAPAGATGATRGSATPTGAASGAVAPTGATRGSATPAGAASVAATPPGPFAAAAPDPDAAPAAGPHPAWKWVAFGAGAAAGAAGGLLLLDADAHRRPEVFRSDAAAAEEAYTSRRDPGLALAITAGVALATGAILWLLEAP